MAAAGPAPRGCSRAGARPFQYGAAANNTSASTQRKQDWRRTALAPAAPRLAARAADAHRRPRSAARHHGKCSLCWASRCETARPAGHCHSGRSAVRAVLRFCGHSRRPGLVLRAFPRSWEYSRLAGAAALFSGSSFRSSGAPPACPQRRKSGGRKTCSFLTALEAFVCPVLFRMLVASSSSLKASVKTNEIASVGDFSRGKVKKPLRSAQVPGADSLRRAQTCLGFVIAVQSAKPKLP